MPVCESVKREEDPDRIERNQAARVAAESRDEDRGENGQNDDAVREDQLIAAVGELARKKPIAR